MEKMVVVYGAEQCQAVQRRNNIKYTTSIFHPNVTVMMIMIMMKRRRKRMKKRIMMMINRRRGRG